NNHIRYHFFPPFAGHLTNTRFNLTTFFVVQATTFQEVWFILLVMIQDQKNVRISLLVFLTLAGSFRFRHFLSAILTTAHVSLNESKTNRFHKVLADYTEYLLHLPGRSSSLFLLPAVASFLLISCFLVRVV